jgi:Na+/H+ antiporter NhaD/arsenite permease-like protein
MLLTFTLLFAVILLVSIFKPEINPGVLALAFVFLLLPLLPSEKPLIPSQLFPTSLFLTLLGVTLFFSCVHITGLVEIVLKRVLQKSENHPKALPLVLFAVISALTASGLGNIGTVALIAPLALPLARELGISAFSMTLLVVGAANASSFSPLTLPGIFTNDFVQKSSHLAQSGTVFPIRWLLFWGVFITISAVTFISFKATRRSRHDGPNDEPRNRERTEPLPSEVIRERDSHTPALTSEQRKTATLCLFLAATFIVSSVLTVPAMASHFPDTFNTLLKRLSDVGCMGWVGSMLMLFFLSARFESALKNVPWATLVLVCGMSTYIEMLTRAGLPEALSKVVQSTVSPFWMSPAFASGSALLSAFTSSVGVALPAFLPLADAVAENLTAESKNTLLLGIAAGSHLVDASPLSTLGALCLAQISESRVRTQVYRQLLIYSFCMIPLAALCTLLFKIVF